MVRQMNLDGWQTSRMAELLRRQSEGMGRGESRELYRWVLEEDDQCYRETVCTLVRDHVIEQMVVSGGPLPPRFDRQSVYSIEEYPKTLLARSRTRFRELASKLEATSERADRTHA